MPDQSGGRIINISSVLGKFGVPGYTAYCTTKHGMIGFTRALALEVVDRGITVNALCPGWVDTEMATLGIKADRGAPRHHAGAIQSSSRWRPSQSKGFSKPMRWRTWFAMSLQNKQRALPARPSISAAARQWFEDKPQCTDCTALSRSHLQWFVRHRLRKSEIFCC